MTDLHTDDHDVIARLRAALDEVTLDSGDVLVLGTPRDRRPLLAVAAVSALLVGAGVFALSRREADPVESVPATEPSVTQPPARPGSTLPYVLISPDMIFDGEGVDDASGEPGEVNMAWIATTGIADGLLTLRTASSPQDVSLGDNGTLRIDGDTHLYVFSYGLTTDERETLVNSIVPGSGLPYVLPDPAFEVVALADPAASSTINRYGNGRGVVMLDGGQYSGQFADIVGAASITETTVAGQPGWRADGIPNVGTIVIWQSPDNSQWMRMRIEETLTDRVDGLIAAIAPRA